MTTRPSNTRVSIERATDVNDTRSIEIQHEAPTHNVEAPTTSIDQSPAPNHSASDLIHNFRTTMKEASQALLLLRERDSRISDSQATRDACEYIYTRGLATRHHYRQYNRYTYSVMYTALPQDISEALEPMIQQRKSEAQAWTKVLEWLTTARDRETDVMTSLDIHMQMSVVRYQVMTLDPSIHIPAETVKLPVNACHNCGGCGYEDECGNPYHDATCHICEGTGTEELNTCIECDGLGWVDSLCFDHAETCMTCLGKGVMDASDVDALNARFEVQHG